MRTTKKLLALFFVAAIITLSGCKEDDPEAGPLPQNPPQQPQNNPELVGTTWMSNLQNDFTYQGVTMHLDLQSTLDFTDIKNGEWFLDLLVTVPSMPSYPGQNQNETLLFTYTFDGTAIVLTETYTNEETGETETYDYNAVYDPNAQTITINLDDEEMVEMMGTDVMVFTKIR